MWGGAGIMCLYHSPPHGFEHQGELQLRCPGRWWHLQVLASHPARYYYLIWVAMCISDSWLLAVAWTPCPMSVRFRLFPWRQTPWFSQFLATHSILHILPGLCHSGWLQICLWDVWVSDWLPTTSRLASPSPSAV